MLLQYKIKNCYTLQCNTLLKELLSRSYYNIDSRHTIILNLL